MKRTKKLLSIILSICILFSIITGLDFSAYALASSGSCGINVKYTFNNTTGELVISGSGPMKNYTGEDNPNSPFSNQLNIISVTIGEGVTSIGNNVFYGCKGIINITIPESVTSIGNQSFYNCRALESITIPSSITKIGDNAFEYCTGLNKVNINNIEAWCKVQMTCPASNPLFYAKNLYLNDELITDLVIPYGISEIQAYGFYHCTSLKSVTIPESVTSIGAMAFSVCSNLIKVNITDIDSWCKAMHYSSFPSQVVFYLNDEKITKVTIPKDLSCINSYTFCGFTNLESVEIPDNITCIDSYAFYGCTELSNVRIGNNVTSINDFAFYNCSGLTTVIIPKSVINVKYGAFYNCSNLHDVYYCGTDKDWGNIAFGNNVIQTTAVITYHTSCEFTNLIETKDSTCNEDGYNMYQCDICKSTYKEILPCGHIFSTYVSDENASCTIDGTKTAKCDRCDATNTLDDVNSKLGHNYIGTTIQPTHLNNGYITYTCSRCNDAYTTYPSDLLAEGHKVGSSTIENNVAPTCTTDGSYDEVLYCAVCHQEFGRKNKTVPSLGHKAGNIVVENCINPTCTLDGLYDEVTYCTVCEEELSRDTFIIKASHNYEIADVIEPDCLNNGLTIIVCSVCDDMIIEEPKALGHNVVIDPAIAVTCITDGLTQGLYCSRCNEVLIEQEIIPALKHNYVITDSQAPTCTGDGYNTYTCQNCNDTYTEAIEKTGHSNYLYRTTASCEKAGYDIYKCSVCSALTSVKVDALGHICDLFNGVVDNELSYFCSRCSKDYTMSASNVLELWNTSVINASTKEYPELDVVNDGIINAKDYAKLKHLQKYNN